MLQRGRWEHFMCAAAFELVGLEQMSLTEATGTDLTPRNFHTSYFSLCHGQIVGRKQV